MERVREDKRGREGGTEERNKEDYEERERTGSMKRREKGKLRVLKRVNRIKMSEFSSHNFFSNYVDPRLGKNKELLYTKLERFGYDTSVNRHYIFHVYVSVFKGQQPSFVYVIF